MTRPITAALAVLVPLASAGFARILNVPAQYNTITDAIADSRDNDTILVQPGTYREFLIFPPHPLKVGSLRLTTGDDDFIARTIIDADSLGRSAVRISGGNDDRTVLDGFTIRNAQTDYGGGIYVRSSSPVLRYLVVENCRAARSGGAIYCTQGAAPRIDAVTVRNNWATIGSGLALNTSAAEVSQSVFAENLTDEHGGAIHATSQSQVSLEEVVVADNQGQLFGGGVHANLGSRLELRNCRITGNQGGNGGGVTVRADAALTMEDCLLQGNHTQNQGGGLFLLDVAWSEIRRCEFAANSAEAQGGAVAVTIADSVRFDRCLFYDNQSGAGAALFLQAGPLTLANVTMVANRADSCGGVMTYGGAHLKAVNSIFWNNPAPQIASYPDFTDEIVLAYCDLQGGADGVLTQDGEDTRSWGDGLFSADPRFADPDAEDFTLTNLSPCIDAGDPESPPDPDGSVADLGRFHFPHRGLVHGFILRALNGEPLPGARVTTDYGRTAVADRLGYWRIPFALPRPFTLTASWPGFNPARSEELEIGPEDTLLVTLRLTRPGLALNMERMEEVLMPGGFTFHQVLLSNDGDGGLEWAAQPRARSGREPWTTLRNVPLDYPQPYRPLSLSFNRGRERPAWFVCGAVSDPRPRFRLWVYDPTWGNPQSYDLDRPLADLTCDDSDWVWGVDALSPTEIHGLHPATAETRFWEMPETTAVTALTWDSARAVFWMTDASGWLFPASPLQPPSPPVTRLSREVTALSFWKDDPDGFPLYAFSPGEDDLAVLKIDPSTGDTLAAAGLNPPGGNYVGAAAVGIDPSSSSWVAAAPFVAVDEHAYINLRYMAPRSDWLTLDAYSGSLAPDSGIYITLFFDASDLDTGRFEAEVVFTSAVGGEAILPVVLFVVTEDVPPGPSALPADFSITSVRPNPFNSSTRVHFRLPAPSPVVLSVYDLTGRLVLRRAAGLLPAGPHTIALHTPDLPSGLFFLCLQSGAQSRWARLLSLK